MKYFITSFLILILSLVNAQQILPNFQKHTVKSGETAKTIVAKYKISFRDFQLLNDFPADVKLSVGQQVLIRQLNPGESSVVETNTTPTPKPTPAKNTAAKSETTNTTTTAKPVAKAETSSPNPVAKKTEPKTEPIEAKEKQSAPTATQASVPVEKPVVTKADYTGPNGTKYAPANDGFHLVKTGQTFYRIALINGLTVDELKALNHMTNTNVEVGQVLKVR